jgi:hypothetical protein
VSLIDRQYRGLACGECGDRISSNEFAAYWMAKNADGFKFCTDACAKLANDANPSGRFYAPRSVRCSAKAEGER